MTDLVETWEAVERLLRDASATLSSPLRNGNSARDTLDVFENFLQHNELELAWDELAEVGNRDGAAANFWTFLAEAARRMELPDKAQQASQRAVVKSLSAVC